MSSQSHHTQKEREQQVPDQFRESGWQEIVCLLPAEVSHQARCLDAFTRARGLRDPLDLLRGILTYVFCLTSFRQVGSWAKSIQLCPNGPRSWAKRTKQAAPWLLWIVERLLMPLPPEQPSGVHLPTSFAGRVHLVDASNLRSWKRNGDLCRLHCSYDLLGRRLEEVRFTDQHVGEGLRHFQFSPGDLVVADSAYCRRQALIEQMDAGVQVLVRLHWSLTPLQEADGSPFDLSGWLKSLEAEAGGETRVVLAYRKRQVPMRLIALRLSEEAAKRSHRKRREQARKHSRKNKPLTIQIADWLVLLTSLPAPVWSAQMILEVYRARWQIELLFKRIKSLVRLHRLRSPQPQSNQAVLAALLIGWILLEQQARKVRADLAGELEADRPISTWALCALLVQSLRTMLLGCWTWSLLRASLLLDREAVVVPRQKKRSQQEATIVEQLTRFLCESSCGRSLS